MRRSLLTSAFMLASVLLPATRAVAFCEQGAAHPCVDDGLPPVCHREITEQGLAFMRPELLEKVVDGNLHMDLEHKNARWEHSDSCDFHTTGTNINFIYANPSGGGAVDTDFFFGLCLPTSCDTPHSDSRSVVGFLDPAAPRPVGAAGVFGYAMHPIQDFYSHSNWLELFDRAGVALEEIPLLEPTVDLWRAQPWEPLIVSAPLLASLGVDAVVLAQEDGYGGWPYDGPVQKPVVSIEGAAYAAIFSDTNTWVEDECVSGMGASHDVINKDTSCRMDPFYHPVTDHYAAARLATRQTAHEWCRILHLANERWGQSGVSAAMGLWVDPGAAVTGEGSAHPPGTPCAATTPGDLEIRVDVDGITLRRDRSENYRFNAVLALYTHDLTRSGRAEVSLEVDAVGGRLLDDSAPGPVTLCLTEEQANAAVATVQGWRDDPDFGGEPGRLDEADHAFAGIYAEVGLHALGVHTIESPDLEVTLDIQHAPTDSDADGLFRCAEELRGTDPADADSDDDGLDDGAEIAEGTDPLDADTDDDGAADGADNCALTANAGQEDYESDGAGDACDLDDDDDGVEDASDAFPQGDLRPTVGVGSCDSGIANDYVFPDGANYNDLIGLCTANAATHGNLVSCVTALSNAWARERLILPRYKASITRCAAHARP